MSPLLLAELSLITPLRLGFIRQGLAQVCIQLLVEYLGQVTTRLKSRTPLRQKESLDQ